VSEPEESKAEPAEPEPIEPAEPDQQGAGSKQGQTPNTEPEVLKAEKNMEQENPVITKPREQDKSERTKVWSVEPGEAVDLASGSSAIESATPVTVGQVFRRTRDKYADRPGIKFKSEGNWISVTYAEYYSTCCKAAKSFLKVYTRVIFKL